MWTTPFGVVQAQRHVHGVSTGSGLLAFGRAGAAQAFSCEFETAGVVDEAVEDGIGVGRIADELMPAFDGQLAGDDGGTPAVAVVEDFQDVVAGGSRPQSSRMRTSARPRVRSRRGWRPSPRASARSAKSLGTR